MQGLIADIRNKTLPQINDTLADVRTKTVPLVNTTLGKFGDTADSFKKTGDNATALTADMCRAISRLSKNITRLRIRPLR